MVAARSVVITGASAGLGEALAFAYAAPGVRLGLIARNAERLAVVAARCRAAGAVVEVGAIDLTEAAVTAAWLAAFSAAGPIDLLIANAGAFSGHAAAGMETRSAMDALIALNLSSVIATIDAVLPDMRQRKQGRIAIVSSLAALQPLADAPAYSATKSAVASYGEALREYLIADGVGVTVVYPGHIATRQAEIQVGALPMMVSPAKAAQRIKRGLDRGRATISFPWPMLWLIWSGRLLPWRLRALAGVGFRFHVDPTKPDHRS